MTLSNDNALYVVNVNKGNLPVFESGELISSLNKLVSNLNFQSLYSVENNNMLEQLNTPCDFNKELLQKAGNAQKNTALLIAAAKKLDRLIMEVNNLLNICNSLDEDQNIYEKNLAKQLKKIESVYKDPKIFELFSTYGIFSEWNLCELKLNTISFELDKRAVNVKIVSDAISLLKFDRERIDKILEKNNMILNLLLVARENKSANFSNLEKLAEISSSKKGG